MSILKPNPPYDLFEEVNVGRRVFIVQEDHGSKTPFSKKMLIGFGGIILAAVLLFVVGYICSGSADDSVGELPYLSSFYSVLGQEQKAVSRSLRSAGAQVTYDPEIKGYRLKEPVEFAGHLFTVTLSFDENSRLRSVTYTPPSYDDAQMMASITCQLLANTQDAWGFSQGLIFSRYYVDWDYEDLKNAFAGRESWQREVTWIVDKDISNLTLAEGDCVSIRFCADNPGNGEISQLRFVFGADTAGSEDFVYDAGVFTGIYG